MATMAGLTNRLRVSSQAQIDHNYELKKLPFQIPNSIYSAGQIQLHKRSGRNSRVVLGTTFEEKISKNQESRFQVPILKNH